MRSKCILILIIAGALCSPARADLVTLKNGDRLSGKIVRSDGKTLVIKTEFAGDVTVKWEAIEQINSDSPLYLTLADGRTVSGPVATANNQLEVRTAGGAVAIDKATVQSLRSEQEQAAFVRRQNPGWLELWSGSADFGLALTQGNTNTTNLSLGLALARETARDKASVYMAGLYAHDHRNGESVTTANAIRGGLRYDRNISRRWFGYVFTGLERNRVQDLNLRLVLGGGLGYHAIQGERLQLDLLGGGNWNHEDFRGDAHDRDSAELHFGQTLSYRLNSRASLKEQFFIFPNLSDGGEYRMNFDTSFVTDITKRISWQTTVSDRYLSNPPLGTTKNDLLLTTGLSFKIGTRQ